MRLEILYAKQNTRVVRTSIVFELVDLGEVNLDTKDDE